MRTFGPFDVDYIVARNLVVKTADGASVTPSRVRIGLVPAGARSSAIETWHDTTAAGDGSPQLLLAGPMASAPDAVTISQSMDAHAEFTVGSLVLVEELGRVPYRA
jgi:hypothetical protein